MTDKFFHKKRILIPIVGQGSIIHIIRTGMLKKMCGFCTPVVVLMWEQLDLINELKQDGFEIHVMPAYNVSNTYKAIRLKVNYWYQYFRLKTDSTDIQKELNFQFRAAKSVQKQKLREKLLWYKLKFVPGYSKKLVRAEKEQFQKEETYIIFKQWVNSLKANGIFTVTPFLLEVEIIARVLKDSGAALIASIHSFDNITKRGWPAIFFDNYFVWNKYNKAELERINPAFKTANNITIAGAPQFDFHYNPAYCWTKTEWCEKLGIPPHKKIVLYAGGSYNLIPNEPQYVKHLAEALQRDFTKGDVAILFRCHPLDSIQRWKDFIGDHPFLYYDYKAPAKGKLDHNNFTADDERRLISTLQHTDVHISLCSTMTVDGSIFNKPQVAPYYDDINKNAEPFFRSIYNQEHYRPIINSGVLNLARSKEELVLFVKNALANPQDYNKHCADCVREIATYNDGASTERVIAKMKTFFS